MANGETLIFEGEMRKVLNLMKKTFYSNKEIFLRELINNAFNALDKIQFESLTYMSTLDDELIIKLVPHMANKTLSIIDNGIGMTKDDLIDSLSVGFYSAYLVAHKVIVTSKHNDLDQYIWESQPDGSFIVTRDIKGQQLLRGTKITLFLKDDQLGYLKEITIKNLIKKHCQRITHPVYLWSENVKDHWQLINFRSIKAELENKLVGEKLGNHLPDELAFLIFLKLPLKSLKRFRRLCKSWALLFENSYSIDLFRINFKLNHHSYYDDTSILASFTKDEDWRNDKLPSLFLLSGERFESTDKLNWPYPVEGHLRGINILGSSSVNGILCLRLNHDRIMYLWNPVTDELKLIPPSPVESVPCFVDPYIISLSFGYDCVRDDYKVIRYMHFFINDDWCDSEWDLSDVIEIYSLRSNSWRKLEINILFRAIEDNNNLYLEGMCHWLGISDIDEMFLVSFDMTSETYYTTLVPLDMFLERYDNYTTYDVERYLFPSNGSIALILKCRHTTTFYISVLGELGKKETWNKLFITGTLPCIATIIGMTMNNILLQTCDGELAWFELSTHKLEKVDVKVYNGAFEIIVYKESLLQMEGINS